MPTFSGEQLQGIASAIFAAIGAPEDVAASMARTLVECDLVGHESHGVIRIPNYVERVEAGLCRPDARPAILRETSTTAVVKGNWAFGQVAARFAAETAIRKAREMNLAAVGVVECHHQGRLGEYSTMIAREGMVGMVVTGGFGAGFRSVAPFGGAARALGTNPYSFAVPAGDRAIFLADFATSVAAEGKIRVAVAKGTSVPEGVLVDALGRPTTDPNDFARGGMLLPFGGHKGYALSLLADLLGSLLSGAEAAGKPPYTFGTFMMALRVDAFRPFEEFAAAVDGRLAEIKAVPPAPGFAEVLIPGEPEERTREQRLRSGIPVAQDTWSKIVAIAGRYGVDVDALLGRS